MRAPPPLLRPLPLSVFIIARDEADRIGAAIEAVRGLSDDIVVVDSGSTDGTQALAEGLGARVVHNDWPGYGQQKRHAETLCRHGWMLNVDADEVVAQELADEIAALFASGAPAPGAWAIPIVEMFPGERSPHPLAFTLSPVRLYHRDAGTYSTSPVHDRVDLAPGVRAGALKGRILHRSIRSLGHELVKLNAYADLQAADMDAKGRRVPAVRLLLEFPLAFLKAYVARRHAVRGLYGFMTAMNYAFFRYLRVAKHWERRLSRGD